jgi:hypothetical protein
MSTVLMFDPKHNALYAAPEHFKGMARLIHPDSYHSVVSLVIPANHEDLVEFDFDKHSELLNRDLLQFVCWLFI